MFSAAGLTICPRGSWGEVFTFSHWPSEGLCGGGPQIGAIGNSYTVPGIYQRAE